MTEQDEEMKQASKSRHCTGKGAPAKNCSKLFSGSPEMTVFWHSPLLSMHIEGKHIPLLARRKMTLYPGVVSVGIPFQPSLPARTGSGKMVGEKLDAWSHLCHLLVQRWRGNMGHDQLFKVMLRLGHSKQPTGFLSHSATHVQLCCDRHHADPYVCVLRCGNCRVHISGVA